MTLRIQRLTARLADLNIEAILVSDPINVSYLSGFTGDSSYLLVESRESTLLTDGRYETQAADECPALTLAIRPSSQPILGLVKEVLGDRALRRVALEASHLSLEAFSSLKSLMPEVSWDPTVGLIEGLRVIKDAEELATIRRSIQIAERSLRSVIAKLTPAWTEREIAFELEATMRVLGAAGVSFPPIVAAGTAAALPHYRPRQIPIASAEMLLIDWGANFQGYASDLTRTFHLRPTSARFAAAYQAVLASQLKAIEAIGPGVKASQVDAVARDSLRAAGWGEAFKHGLGHGIGLQIHESPRLSASSDETLLPGMVVTVEPGVYFEGEFGIRIEDDVLVTDQGRELLSHLPKGLDDCRLIL